MLSFFYFICLFSYVYVSTISVCFFLIFFLFTYNEKNKGFFNAKLISEKIVGSFYYLVGIEQSQFWFYLVVFLF